MDSCSSTQLSVPLRRDDSTEVSEPSLPTDATSTPFTEEELDAIESKSTIARFIFFPIGLFGLYFIKHPWPIDHWAVTSMWMVYSGYIFFCWTSCFHETIHQTLTVRRSVNLSLGRLLGCLIGVPYTVYRESHIRHHAYLNTPRDWELWPYSDPTVSVRFRRVFVWFDIACGALFAPYIYGRIYFHRDSPISSPQLRRTIRNEYIGVAMFWTAILTLVGTSGSWTSFLLVWCVPHAIAGAYQTWRKLTEHLGMSSFDPLEGTRTVIGRSLFTRISSFLNFNIFVHGPHHRHPRIAHDQLEAKMEQYILDNPDRTFPVFNRYWQASFNMLPWLMTNPGVGVNVGGVLDDASAPMITNFEADVATSNAGPEAPSEPRPTEASPSDDVIRRAA